MKDADQRGQVEGLSKAPSAAAIRQLTTDCCLGLGVDFTEGGKPENPEKNPRSTGETNYNNSAHTIGKFWRINTCLHPGGTPIQLEPRLTGP